MSLKLNTKYLENFITADEMNEAKGQAEAAAATLMGGKGAGKEFLGWINLPTEYYTKDENRNELEKIKEAAAEIQKSDILIVIGIGGSYLGARAAIEMIKSPFYNNLKKNTPDIYFVGNNISPTYLNEVVSICEGKDFCINVISKSGTTTEPALAFRVFRDLLYKKHKDDESEADRRIYCTTDKEKGTLKDLADKKKYKTFVVPDDIGGRYSVLTAVGLLPMAVAGCDLDAVIAGAKAAQDALTADFDNNDCYKYAALRNILHSKKNKSIELLVSYDPSFTMMSEWFKQLFGESEGKENKGIFPSAVTFSTDLHSMGQFIQEGSKILFETVVDIKKPKSDFLLEPDASNLDGLNFLTGQNMSVVNRKAMEGTIIAHTDGGVPNIVLELDDLSEKSFGYMVYFFEKACAVSGYMLGINPFDQPGVESYKNNMFALLGKPGYEAKKAELEAKIG